MSQEVSSRFFFSFGWEDAMQWLRTAGRGLRDCAAVLGANFFLVAGWVTKVVGAGCCSAARGGAGFGEQRFPGVVVAVADPHSARGHTHLGGDFQQPQLDRSRLGLGPLGSTRNDGRSACNST